MKKLALYSAFYVAFAFAIITAVCSPVLMVGTLQTVNSTTFTGNTNAAFLYNPALQQFQVTHGALNATNDIAVMVQITADLTNFITIGTWHPSSTNAGSEYIYAGQYLATNSVRVQIVTTNSQQVGVSYGQ